MYIPKKLTLKDIISVLAGEKVELSKESFKKLLKTREFIEQKVVEGKIIYGVNTGVGALANKVLSEIEAKQLQEKILLSHAVGYGENSPDDIVITTMLLRANMLAKGYSGVRPEIVIFLTALINERIIPIVPRYGSVGASGDLAPLAYIALVLTGSDYGVAKYNGKIYRGQELKEILRRVYEKYLNYYSEKGYHVDKSIIDPEGEFLVSLSYKEGLSLINGTEFELAVLINSYMRLKKCFDVAKKAVALTMEALRGIKNAFQPNAIALLNSPEALDISREILDMVNESKLVVDSNEKFCLSNIVNELENKVIIQKEDLIKYGLDIQKIVSVLEQILNKKIKLTLEGESYILDVPYKKIKEICVKWSLLGYVQDPYSIRCVPKVFASVARALSFVESIIQDEMNAITDNPIIICDNDCEVISAGNFHGQPVALASEILALALSYIAGMSERRIFRLLDSNLNRGLPPFLAPKSGTNSGLMITQYLAAALTNLVSNKALPTSNTSLPTSANQEDWNSMGNNSAWKLYDSIRFLERILSIEVLLSAQAIYLRTQGNINLLGKGTREILKQIVEKVDLPFTEDKFFSRYLDIIQKFLFVENL